LVQNSSLPNEDAAALRNDFNGVADFQFSSFNGKAADTPTEVCFPLASACYGIAF